MNKKISWITMILALIVIASASAFSAGLAVEHELGAIVVPESPKTIVVFDYGVLDALDALGVEISGLPTSNLPSFLDKFNSRDYANVGTLFEPNFERIYGLKPDLIIISSRQADQYEELSRIAPTLYVSIDTADYWGSVQSNLRLLGKIFGKEAEVEATIAEFEVELAAIHEKASASGLKALILMANDGALSVYGPQSRFGLIHQAFGFAPADSQIDLANHGQNVSFEYLVKTNPDVLFVIDRAAIAGGSISAQQVLNNPLVKMTKASKADQIIYLNSHAWYVVSGGITSTKLMMGDMKQLFR